MEPKYSWLGDWYATFGATPGAVAASVAAPSLAIADSAWAMERGNPAGSGTATYPLTELVRDQIGLLARTYADVASENWLYSNYGGSPTCNFFVHDVLEEVGVTAPVQPGFTLRRLWRYLTGQVGSPHYPAVAREWANPRNQFQCWDYLAEGPDGSGLGDVVAQELAEEGVTGHVGVVVAQAQSASASTLTDPQGIIVQNDWGFRPGGPGVAGAKSGCVVKRFMCY